MTEKLYFCTLFNSAYLSRGLALYDSLVEHCADFELFVFAFDDVTFSHLKSLNLAKMTVISLTEFEDRDLIGVKPTRSAVEYCWTCTPSVIKYSISRYKLNHCTYLDADIYFFADPKPVIEKFLKSKYSVLITPHNYTSIYEQSATSGKYCVQFMPFKSDETGMTVLNWWREKCLEWCYFRLEDGKLGDQMYLDNWPTSFPGVYEEHEPGVGAAPWNIQQLKLIQDKFLRYETIHDAGIVVFFHYHGLKIHNFNHVSYGNYYLSSAVKKFVYKPYLNKLQEVERKYKLDRLKVDVHACQAHLPLLKRIKIKIKTSLDSLQLALGGD